MKLLLVLLTLIAVGAIFATTRRGREIGKRIGFRDRVAGAAPQADVDFLVEACGGDSAAAARRLAAERERFPDLDEAAHYRKAIRKVMAER